MLGATDLQVADAWAGDRNPLTPATGTDLTALEGLTACAAAAHPDYRPLPVGGEAVTDLISTATGTPVVVTAAGPQRTDRRVLCPTTAF